MRHMIELTDLMDSSNETTATVPVERVEVTIRGWFELGEDFIPENDLEAKIDEFQTAALAEDYDEMASLAAELAIGFDHIQVPDA